MQIFKKNPDDCFVDSPGITLRSSNNKTFFSRYHQVYKISLFYLLLYVKTNTNKCDLDKNI